MALRGAGSRHVVWACIVLLGALVFGCGPENSGNQAGGLFRLTVLHSNDGESRLLNAGHGMEDFGGVARFAAQVKKLRREAQASAASPRGGTIVLSAGDNYLASPEFDVSLKRGVPYFDSLAADLINYDAVGIGNHEFDLGPDVFANFVTDVRSAPFVSANLDFTRQARLQTLAESGRIVPSIVLDVGGEKIGVIGATTPRLSHISRPSNVAVRADLGAIVQGQIDRLRKSGVNKIVLISHLQSIEEDRALASQLRGLALIVAGGGNELLANEGDALIPGEGQDVYGPYPMWAEDADGKRVPVVTTNGDYRYVGRLIVDFDAQGNVVAIDEASGPVRVAGGGLPDAIAPDAEVDAQVTQPVDRALTSLTRKVVATAEVPLDGRRGSVRTEETNVGDVVADAMLAQARALAPQLRAPLADVALVNGGSLRNNTVIPAGPITERDVFDILPFPDVVTLVANVPASQFKELLENAVSRVDRISGRFAQVSGFRFVWSSQAPAQELDRTGAVVKPGQRIRQVTLDDGTVLVRDGAVVPGVRPVNVATTDFLARGGDQSPYRGRAFATLGRSSRKALTDFVRGNLNGVIEAHAYPTGGVGRIVEESGK